MSTIKRGYIEIKYPLLLKDLDRRLKTPPNLGYSVEYLERDLFYRFGLEVVAYSDNSVRVFHKETAWWKGVDTSDTPDYDTIMERGVDIAMQKAEEILEAKLNRRPLDKLKGYLRDNGVKL